MPHHHCLQSFHRGFNEGAKMKGTLCAETAIMRVQVPIDDSETLPRPFGHSDETRILGKVGH